MKLDWPRNLQTKTENTVSIENGPDGGGDSGTKEQQLRSLVKELQQTATNRKIREDPHAIIGDREYILEQVSQYRQQQLKVVEHADGRFELEDKTKTIFWPTDSQAWQDIFDSFQPTIDALLDTLQYDGAWLNMPVTELEAAVSTLNPGGELSDHAEEIIDSNGSLVTEDGVTSFEGYLENTASEWGAIPEVYNALCEWHGRAASVFTGVYLDRFESILVGQMAIAKALAEALAIARAAFTGAVDDAIDLAQAGIDALDGGVGGSDASFSQDLKTISEITKLAGDVAGLFPGVGQKISTLAGYVSKGSGLAAKVVEKYETEQPKPTFSISGSTVDQIMSQVTDNVATIHHTVETVEKTTAELLNGLYELTISDASSGITVYLPRSANGDSISLTIREAFFEPKAPASEKGYGPGLGTMGDRLSDNDASNDPSNDDFRDPDVMGVPPDTGEQFAADLEALWHAGNAWLPEMAENYDSIATHVTDAADGNIEKGFTRQMVSRGVGITEGTGNLYPMWCTLRDEYMTILRNSSENLTAVGATLKAATQSYAAQDEEAAERLRVIFDGDLPWE